jgi:hypothetical protein
LLRHILLLSVAVLVSFSVSRTFAQQTGHYLQGITGLDNGTTLPPGFYASYLPYVYDIDSLRGPRGNTVLQPDLTVVAHNFVYQMTTDKKILGATYGWSFIVPVVNNRLTADILNTTFAQGGLSDLYFAPIVLGWAKGKANYLLDYGFYAPTGDFNASSAVNPGLGYWEHQIQAGVSYSIDARKLWNTSLLSTWEINQSKSGVDLKAGPMVTLEYSFGHRFDKYKMNLGAAGYIYHKLSADSGSDVSPLTAGVLDRSFGIGPEFKYAEPKWHMGFDFHYEHQFGVEAKTQGDAFVVGISWLNFFPPPHK